MRHSSLSLSKNFSQKKYRFNSGNINVAVLLWFKDNTHSTITYVEAIHFSVSPSEVLNQS